MAESRSELYPRSLRLQRGVLGLHFTRTLQAACKSYVVSPIRLTMATLITSTLTAIAKTTLITRPLTTMAISSISKHGGKRNDAQPRSGLEPFTIINWREVESNRLDQREVGKPTI
ncbi:uncharacterized protein K441DRAFT_653492, partial [Cenococcum geophilum 1.58]|uniref:uncharacterized protein n=1 Tax=Cenococcum geophilum 1.58 TaxID=794803 RepID=UPI00358E4217